MRSLLQAAALVLFAAALLCFPEAAAQGARDGLTLCGELLIPALFPFFVLSSLLIATGLAERAARWAGKGMRPLFGVGPSGATAFVLGLVGGYPVGARTIAQLTERGECTQTEARRLALFCNNCGPAFFLGAAGAGVFGSRQAGVILLAANGLAAVFVGGVVHLVRDRRKATLPGTAPEGQLPGLSLAAAFPGAVQSAFTSALGVCAYVVLFSVLTALAQDTGILPWCAGILGSLLPVSQGEGLARAFLLGLLEISTGTAALRTVAESSLALPLAAFLLGWGGLSVHGQSLPFLTQARADLKGYFCAKAFQGAVSAALTAVLVKFFPLSLAAMAGTGVLSAPSLLGREILALWGLAGLSLALPRVCGMTRSATKKGWK